MQLVPEDAPIREWGFVGDVLTVAVFPALVYAAFVWYGGPEAALRARSVELKKPTKDGES
jgi:hypothetical protein